MDDDDDDDDDAVMEMMMLVDDDMGITGDDDWEALMDNECR